VDLISAEGEWFTVRIEIPHQQPGRR
jgi:hypothetical protein